MFTQVELPGLVLTNEPGQRDRAFLANLTQWHDLTETKRDSEPRERGLGLYPDDDPAEGGRFPVVHGRLLSLVDGDELALREQIALIKNYGTFDLVVTDPSGTWRSEVRPSGRPVFTIHNDGWVDFEIPLEAADPRRYRPPQVASTGIPTRGVGITDPVDDPISEGAPGNRGRVTVTNGGSAPSEPTIRVSGGLSAGFEIVHIETGRVIRIERQILPGSVVTIDNSEGVVWIDGQSALSGAYVPVGEWFQVPHQSEATFQWMPLGTVEGAPMMTVELAEASW